MLKLLLKRVLPSVVVLALVVLGCMWHGRGCPSSGIVAYDR